MQLNSLAYDELSLQLARDFQLRFEIEPALLACAPGRFNLIGEHIDYNDGFVLPMAIERYVMIAAAPARDLSHGHAIVHSLELNETARIPISPSSSPSLAGWAAFLRASLLESLKKASMFLPSRR